MAEKKYTDDELKQHVDKSKADMLNKLISLYPYLETEKEQILQCISDQPTAPAPTTTTNPLAPAKKKRNNPIVLEQITFDNVVYFKDKNGGLWSGQAELVGVIRNGTDGEPVCELFCKKYSSLKNFRDYL